MKLFFSILTLLSTFISFAQQPATSADVVQNALKQKREMAKNSLVKNIPFENIGPTIMSGRVVDLAVNPDNPIEFYVAYASGGVWHTKNNGSSFTPILDNSDTQNVGDIAVHWPSRTIWVGTGEKNSSRSSYAGIGILKSKDNGKTWQYVGLPDSHHISRIVINPNNENEVVIGVAGHLYSPNNERGIYKTTDGGATWNKTLFIDNMTGIIDVESAPENFNIMYAASWTRDRKAWNFDGSGNGSAIYKSTDAGTTWTKISDNGIPTGKGVGRIGLAVYNAETVYAFHDNQARRPSTGKKDTTKRGLTKDDFKTMGKDAFLALDNSKLNMYLKTNGFQEKYRAQNVKQLVQNGTVKPIDLAKYLEDANSMLFDTPVIGAEVYKTTNGGKSWKKTHDDYLDGIYFSYGYYFGEVRVSAQNPEHIYVMGVPILKSKDGGKTFKSISRENVHADHQALWVNPKMEGHLINGNDGGLNMSYDDGETWEKLNVPTVGQFYAIQVDNVKPYNVYGGLQDNGVWVGAHNAPVNKAWKQSGKNPWESLMGGDGMQVQVDNRDNNLLYTGFQFGNYYRINRETGEFKRLNIKHNLGETPYRFNWQTPILLSSHNQDILYLGGNKLMRSMNKGDDWEAVSDDLTKGGKPGNVAYGTITSISESPFQFGLIYVGSDDGLVHITKNAGGSWENISATLPKDLWVSRVIASQHKKERVYVTLNGYRWDDFKTYVYMSNDYGKTWKDISANIPASPVNVIKEDSENENILYLGTDNGAYVSFNNGNNWEIFVNNLPNVAVHDMVVQPDAKHLLLGTHGRSIYKADISALQKMNASVTNASLTLFNVKPIRASRQWGSSWSKWLEPFVPKVSIPFYTNTSGEKTVKILSENGAELQRFTTKADKGFNSASYDVSISEKGRKALLKENTKIDISKAKNGSYYLPAGNYTIEINGEKTAFVVK